MTTPHRVKCASCLLMYDQTQENFYFDKGTRCYRSKCIPCTRKNYREKGREKRREKTKLEVNGNELWNINETAIYC